MFVFKYKYDKVVDDLEIAKLRHDILVDRINEKGSQEFIDNAIIVPKKMKKTTLKLLKLLKSCDYI